MEPATFDKRPTVRLHVGMPEKASVVVLSDAAFRLMIETICYCGREESDGLIPNALLVRMAPKPAAIRELVERGHLVKVDEDSWRLPDYLRWNRASSEINSFRASRSESGAKGAHLRWHVPTRTFKPDCPYCTEAESA